MLFISDPSFASATPVDYVLIVRHAREGVLAGIDQAQVFVPHLVPIPVGKGRADDIRRRCDGLDQRNRPGGQPVADFLDHFLQDSPGLERTPSFLLKSSVCPKSEGLFAYFA